MQSAAKKQKFSVNLKVKLEGCPNSNSLPIITRSNGHLVAMLADRNAANAHLFAAAPELLAAIKVAYEFFINPGKFNPVEVERMYEAAIAKAEGR